MAVGGKLAEEEQRGGEGRGDIHFADELLLGFGAQVAVYGGLDLEEVLDYVFEAVWGMLLVLSPSLTRDQSLCCTIDRVVGHGSHMTF